MSASIKIDEYHASYGVGAAFTTDTPTSAYRVQAYYPLPSVNFRICRLWRPDNRYPGTVAVRRHESGGVELSFDALRHGAKPRPSVIVDERDVDKLILSLLEVRKRDPKEPWEE